MKSGVFKVIEKIKEMDSISDNELKKIFAEVGQIATQESENEYMAFLIRNGYIQKGEGDLWIIRKQ